MQSLMFESSEYIRRRPFAEQAWFRGDVWLYRKFSHPSHPKSSHFPMNFSDTAQQIDDFNAVS